MNGAEPGRTDKAKPLDRIFHTAATTVLVIVMLLLGAAWLFPVRNSHESAKNAMSLSNVKRQALALAMYSSDFDDRLPPAAYWMDLSLPYIKSEENFIDPLLEDPKPEDFGYAFFLPMSGADFMKVESPDKMPMTFQSSDLSRNANGYLDLLPYRIEKRRSNILSFLDCHATSMPESWRFEVIVIELPE